MSMSETNNNFGRFFKKKAIIIGLIVIFLLTLPIYYFYTQYQKMYIDYQKTKMLLNKSSEVLEETSNQEIIDKVGKLIELPNETPTIAAISDKSKLQNQPFFANAENGDKVLMYSNAQKAILYRETINKIIEVGAITIDETPNPSPTPTLLPSPTEAESPTSDGSITP